MKNAKKKNGLEKTSLCGAYTSEYENKLNATFQKVGKKV